MAEEEKQEKKEESKQEETKQEEPKQEKQEESKQKDSKQENSEEKSEEEPKVEKSDKKSLIRRLLPWLLIIIIIAVCAGTGFVLGQFISGRRPGKTDESSQQDQAQTEQPETVDLSSTTPGSQWFYELEPVVANLNEPGVTRYVRASLTLEMSANIDIKAGSVFLEEKKPVLTNWLTIYLASLTLEDIRGDRKLRSIQSQIRDAFNEKLFPNAKPQVKHILFREFAIQ